MIALLLEVFMDFCIGVSILIAAFFWRHFLYFKFLYYKRFKMQTPTGKREMQKLIDDLKKI